MGAEGERRKRKERAKRGKLRREGIDTSIMEVEMVCSVVAGGIN